MESNRAVRSRIEIEIKVDRDDRWFGDSDHGNLDDRKDHEVQRAGVGHAMGVLHLIFNDGSTNKVILPHVALSVRSQLD